MDKIISCLVATAIAPIVPPTDKDPVSPINTIAGGALNQRNPKPEPINAAHIMTNSPVSLTKGIFRYSEYIRFPVKYVIKAKDKEVIIIGPIANPSKPSVKFTAFAHPTITTAAKI